VRSDWGRTWLYAVTYAAQGREKESEAALKELIAKYSTYAAFQVAEVYAFRNQPDEAFEWLDRAYAQRDSGLIGAKADPLLKSVQNDPRYSALLKKLKFPT
jgi:predicted Zn-dependent protease